MPKPSVISHTRSHLLKELRALNVTAKELATEGHTLSALKATGYSLKELLNAGFTLEECKGAGVDKKLRASGHRLAELKKAVAPAARTRIAVEPRLKRQLFQIPRAPRKGEEVLTLREMRPRMETKETRGACTAPCGIKAPQAWCTRWPCPVGSSFTVCAGCRKPTALRCKPSPSSNLPMAPRRRL